MKFTTVIGIILFIIISGPLFACTIIYTAEDDNIYGGSNEDYNDPYTYMTIYPPENNKLGWIKFSFGSGFPQAGMNEAGLFWDAASAPFLGMPYSVENKDLYDGPIMQKVIEECSNSAEVQDIFGQYYCSDQFRAQYLIGCSTGVSMIVEGDSILINNGSYQVLTNFNLNHPELGGYPCWRYETANEMLENNEHDLYLMGFILSATHQEGNYPTLYSNIYDLTNKKIYIFYDHNFNEYIKIDLLEEMEQGYSQYLINSQFSMIDSRLPEYDAVITSSTVNISWEGWKDSSYELQYSLDPEFEDFETISINGNHANVKDHLMIFPILTGVLLIGSCSLLKRKFLLILIPAILISSIILSCSFLKETEETDNLGSYSVIIDDLESGNTYYWRIIAQREESNFSSETTIFPFTVLIE